MNEAEKQSQQSDNDTNTSIRRTAGSVMRIMALCVGVSNKQIDSI